MGDGWPTFGVGFSMARRASVSRSWRRHIWPFAPRLRALFTSNTPTFCVFTMPIHTSLVFASKPTKMTRIMLATNFYSHFHTMENLTNSNVNRRQGHSINRLEGHCTRSRGRHNPITAV